MTLTLRRTCRRTIIYIACIIAFMTLPITATDDDSNPHETPISEPRSDPVAHESHAPASKFTEREAMYIEDVVFGTDATGFRQSQCPMDTSLIWTTAVNTGIYASSVISHLYSDMSEGKQVIVPGFHRDLNILDHDGHHIPGSPINMATEVYFHASPVLTDFNHDGIKDIVWVNVDGEIYVMNGDPTADQAVMDYPWSIPKLKLKKRWYADLAPKPQAPKATPSSTPTSTPATPSAPPPTARRLMSLDGYENPLQRMRREKQKQYTLRRVVNKLRAKKSGRMGTARRRRAVSKPQGRSGRRLLQASTKADAGPVFEREDGIEQDDTEVDDVAQVEEPVQAIDPEDAHHYLAKLRNKYAPGHGHDAEMSGFVDEEERQFLEDTGLTMPDPSEGGVDDQEVVDPEYIDGEEGELHAGGEESTEHHPEGDYGEEAAWTQKEMDEFDAKEQAALEAQQLAAEGGETNAAGSVAGSASDEEGWVAGTRPGGVAPSLEEELNEYSSDDIQAAVDELVKEDPEFEEQLQATVRRQKDGQQTAAGDEASEQTGDAAADVPAVNNRAQYSDMIKNLAAKYTKQQAEIYERQRAEGDGKIQMPEMNSAPEAPAGSEHIASKDAQLAFEREAAAKKKADINSNVVRILGDTKQQQAALETDETEPEQLDSSYSQVADGLTDEGRESLNLFTDTSARLDAYDPEIAWEMAELDRLYPITENEIWVDAHVLATPVLQDLTGDGRAELILTVSYFFDDTDYHANPRLLRRLGADVDIKKYVAGGLVVVDLWTHKILWQEHLDLTTDEVELKAYIYASPTIIDLDGDGVLEIIVATSLGLIYVFNSQTHAVLRGFPLTMHEIQAQVSVGDVNQDGILELVAMDGRGNVLCFDMTGRELWNTLISGFSSQPASFGDINGDGLIDVVIGTVSGHVWALNGLDGKVLPHFPLRTDGRIISPITLVNLDPEPTQLIPYNLVRSGLHLVFPSFDGHVYIVDGRSGCTNKLDIGEHSYGQVLVSDILGRGKLDLLVTTMNGNVFCFSTEADSDNHPLKAWESQAHGLNVFHSRDNYHGVHFTHACKTGLRDIAGRDFQVEYIIVDERAKVATPSLMAKQVVKPRYDVFFRFSGQIVANVTHDKPGQYSYTLAAGRLPQYTTIELVMKNEHGQVFHDEVVSGMNVHFYKSIKYLVIIPFCVMFGLMLLVKQGTGPALPS